MDLGLTVGVPHVPHYLTIVPGVEDPMLVPSYSVIQEIVMHVKIIQEFAMNVKIIEKIVMQVKLIREISMNVEIIQEKLP